MITLKSDYIDGKMVGYCSETVFLVQVGKGRKGSYRTRSHTVGNLGQAVMLYKMLNVHSGYKKRLVMVGGNKPFLARQLP